MEVAEHHALNHLWLGFFWEFSAVICLYSLAVLGVGSLLFCENMALSAVRDWREGGCEGYVRTRVSGQRRSLGCCADETACVWR